jgi:predicted ATPase/serine/threonine protein kinase/DNA-binding CsgD family transcriptional regulator
MGSWRVSNREGQQLGNYRLLHLIGQGSFAEVYLGEHLHLGTQAAIKVLHSQFTREEKEQFYTEARTLARLIHPHIIRIHDFAVEDGIPFLVMDYAPNGSLRQRHPRGTRVPLATIVSYVKQVADALDYIHEQKLIHRDVKPENMLLGRNNEVLLTEFDIAIIALSSRSQQTQEAAGAIAYMAPEQLRGRPRTASDQYSLAVVVYEWLSGDPPFSGLPREIFSQHLSAPPPPLHTKVPPISPAIEHVVLKALAKEPKERFASLQAFARAFEEAFNPESLRRTLFTPSSGDLTQSEQQRPPPRDLPIGTVTLLLMDIEASTRLLQQLGEHHAAVLADFQQLLRTIFYQCHGHEVDMQGDALFVAFARATDAVSAAIAVQRALADHPWPEGISVRIRAGLHTGEPLLTPEGYVGPDVQQAIRIMNAGHGGQILLSQTTTNLVEQDLPDDVKLDDLGEHRFTDLGRPKRIFQLSISDIPANFPPLKTLATYPNNLPVQHTPFIGREQEVAAVCDLLRRENTRLLTLTGPGGTGKTRLALQAAAELCETFTDGVFFVNLAPISDPAFVVRITAETLGIQEGADWSLLERLKENLWQKHVLLLLDNFEQVASAAVQVVDLLAACLQLKVMVTSREVLHVRAEREFPVPPLPLPDPKRLPDLTALSHYTAVALFTQRAQAVKSDFQLTNANARAIAEICARLDGLPLAIELAAARIKLLLPQALLARLDQRLDVLTGHWRDVPARQQTLRNTIAWSYNLLDAQEQRLFRLLSVFVDGCTLQEVERLCVALDGREAAGQMVDRVALLIDKSLVQQIEQEGQELRLVMLETIREYAMECLIVNGELEATQQALAAVGQIIRPTPTPVELSSTSHVKPAATYPDGLTVREVEVLRLVAQGLTDVQVADQLVISPRTVNGHLRSIYSKIGVTSRSAATRYAVDSHLA